MKAGFLPLPPVLAASCYAVGLALLHPYLAIRMDQAGYGPTAIGLVASVWALGVFIAPLVLPMLLKRFHMGTILAAGFVCNLSLLPLYRIFEVPLLWALMGFLVSAFTGAIFLINESWLIKEVDDAHRGKASGIYISASTFGLSAGPWLLGRLDFDSWSPILWLVAIQILCGLVLLVSRKPRFELPRRPSFNGFLAVFKTMPVIYVLAAMFSAIELTLRSLLSPYSLMLGVDVAQATGILGAVYFGAGLLALPVGLMADRLPLKMILLTAIVVLLGGAAGLHQLAISGTAPALVAFAAFGGAMATIYCTILVMLGRVFARSRLIEANALFAVFYGLGAFVGPTLGGLSMDLLPPYGLAFFIATLALVGGVAILMSKLPARVELIEKARVERARVKKPWAKAGAKARPAAISLNAPSVGSAEPMPIRVAPRPGKRSAKSRARVPP